MCAPVVMEAVRREIRRRDLLRLAGTATVTAAAARLVGAPQVLAAPMRRASRVQDLTHTLKPTFPSFSGQPVFKSDVAVSWKKDGYYALTVAYFEHIGTHMDASAHFGERALKVHELPAATLIARWRLSTSTSGRPGTTTRA